MKNKMNFGLNCFMVMVFVVIHFSGQVYGQTLSPSEQDSLKAKILGKLNNFTFGMYVDAYINQNFGNPNDTSNLVPYSANCPIQNQIRMNVAALEFFYNNDKVRGKLGIQYGDAPNLLASPNAQFIKTLRQANFGFRVAKKIWLDFGYIFNPIGYESSWPVLNQISVVTMGGYFAPGSVLGAKFSWQINDKLDCGIMFGNFFSLAYAQNTNMYGIMFINYRPKSNLRFTYNNLMGNQALARAEVEQNILYNDFLVTWQPFVNKFELVGQFDFAFQTNSQLPPNNDKIAAMFSGFIQARYIFNSIFSISSRNEFLEDPDGFLTGVNTLTKRGLQFVGFATSFEYKPVSFGYMRIAYRYLEGYPGSKLFYSNTSDIMTSLIFSTGIRF